MPVAPTALTPTPGFQDTTVFSGLSSPTAVRFASDGRVFVAEKSGLIKVFASVTATTPTIFADLRTQVDNYWDRGLLGLALDPGFPTVPYVYVSYTYDAVPGGSAPRWNDVCDSPPGPTTDGCVVSGRISRLQASGSVMTGSEKVLITDWCQQWPSHSIGDLRFGADGALYASGGDGASFSDADYGQHGTTGGITTKNPCGDPPGGIGATLTPPTAQGGALRSQSLRRPSGQPTVLDGTIIRVDPATGAALSTNPLFGSADTNARRIVGYGLRNPFRFAFRPGTNDLWVGDVGWSTWEEIERIPDPLSSQVANFGWPCYEGTGHQPQYEAVGLNSCTSLYANTTGLVSPFYTYDHGAKVVPGETCPTANGSSTTGIAFYPAFGGSYGSSYQGALFFADHTRNCIWVMKTTSGLPDPGKISTFVSGAGNPVDLQIGPGGDLFYADLEGGKVHRIVSLAGQAPTAVISAVPTSGSPPLTVAFDGTGSSDPEGGALTYSWDLDGDGTYGDSTSPTPSHTYTVAGQVTVGLRVTDPTSLTGSTTTVIDVNPSLPSPVIDTPGGSLTWSVGDLINFSGHGTNASGNPIPASGLSWTLLIHHCPSACHTHTVQTWAGVSSGSFNAPDHDYPTYLELILTATSSGQSASTSLELDPKTVDLTLKTVPSGLSVGVGSAPAAPTPYTVPVIKQSNQTLSAPLTQTLGSTTYAFSSWSDGGAATHAITAATNQTYTATYAVSTSTTSYLSDLPYTVTANGWGPPEKDRSNGENLSGDGGPLTLAGVVYSKGLGTHAASDVRYSASGCTLFSAKVGVDDEVGALGSIVFQVFGDGTKLYDSGVMTGTSPTATANVDVTGKTDLRFIVTNGGDNINYDHGDWADAKLTCGGGGPPPDTTPPIVTGTTPASGATGVATSVSPTATFNEAIDPATINTTTVTLVRTGTSTVLAASVTYNAATKIATLAPSAALLAGTGYTATVKGGTGGVKDLAGNLLAANVSWSFTTATGSSTTSYLSDLPYTVTANGWGPPEKDRSNGENLSGDGGPLTLAGVVYSKGLGTHAASDVRYSASGCTLFSAKVGVDDEVGALGSIVFQVFGDGTKLYDSGVMTGTSPTATANVDVTGKTDLRFIVTNGGDNINYDHGDWADAKLTCGGGGPPPDTTPPIVTGTTPASGATGVATSVSPTATFNEAIDPATINTTTVTLVRTGTSTVLAASVTYNAATKIATLAPSAALLAGTGYTATVKGGTGGVKDLAGNLLAANVSWSFTTATGSSTTSYLSDLPYTVTANGWGPPEKDRSNGENLSGDGGPLTLAGVVYSKGLGTHAASDVRYSASGCTLFSAKVGVDDEVGALGSIVFQVFGDGTKLYDSGVMTGTSPTATANVDVTGKTDLRFIVTNGGDNINYDHGDWADAKLTCGT